MTSAYTYEFKKGKLVQPLLRDSRTRELQHCVYRELLADRDKLGPVDVHKLFTGPMHNPLHEVVEQHTYSLLLTRRSRPERGGLCKYFLEHLYEYCGYCREEHAVAVRREMALAKDVEDAEVEDLLRSVDVISGKNKGIRKDPSNVFVEVVSDGELGSRQICCSKNCCSDCSRMQLKHRCQRQ